jgi:hypothetical protein
VKKTGIFVTIWMLGSVLLFAQQVDTLKSDRISFYQGPVTIESITGRIILDREGQPEFRFDWNVANVSGKAEDISIGFRNSTSEKIRIGAGERMTHAFIPVFQISGKGEPTRGLKIDLVPVINGLVPAKAIPRTSIRVELPEGIVLLRSSKPAKVSTEGNNTILMYDEQDRYLTPLTLVINTSGMGLEIRKSLKPERVVPGPVEVTLNITNLGQRALSEVQLEDSFDPRDFSAEGPDFSLYQGEENDSRILWNSTIDRLGPGESTEVLYTVKANYPVTNVTLDAAKATVKGILVGVSNKVRL